MEIERMLRVSRTDEDNSFILLHVSAKDGTLRDMDLKATDGAQPYVANVKEGQIEGFRAKQNQMDAEEWKAVLANILLGVVDKTGAQASHHSIEISATQPSEREIVLSLRQTVSGIHNRLGTIALALKPEEEIELFDWAGLAAQQASSERARMAQLEGENSRIKKSVERLSAQLSELTASKESHERMILEKCRQLINNKKLKIRDQQRLLATAKIDRGLANQVHNMRSAAESPDADVSAAASPQIKKEVDEAGSGRSKRNRPEENHRPERRQASRRHQHSSEDDASTTADSQDSEDDNAEEPQTSQTQHTKTDTNTVPETWAMKKVNEDLESEAKPPASRALPFSARTAKVTSPEEDADETDDEL